MIGMTLILDVEAPEDIDRGELLLALRHHLLADNSFHVDTPIRPHHSAKVRKFVRISTVREIGYE